MVAIDEEHKWSVRNELQSLKLAYHAVHGGPGGPSPQQILVKRAVVVEVGVALQGGDQLSPAPEVHARMGAVVLQRTHEQQARALARRKGAICDHVVDDVSVRVAPVALESQLRLIDETPKAVSMKGGLRTEEAGRVGVKGCVLVSLGR